MRIFVLNFVKRRYSARFFSILLILVVLLSSTVGVVLKKYGSELLSASVDADAVPTFIIDAGHGGEDSGAVGVNGELEKDLNLSISLYIGAVLKEQGYSVIYTRTEDKLLYKPEEDVRGIRKISDLKNRCAVAKENPDAIFISIHMNSFGQSKYSGLQVYYSENNPESRLLAASIQAAVKDTLQPQNNRKIKTGEGMYLLENTENVSVLVECGFLTNPMECEKLSNKEYQKELSFSIVCGIIEYIDK